ncbi:MAG: hypothetical protein VX777_10820, partial [Chlamydiota bacterium]|nr:hypothetical protein [Chlamydiota bacterium]
NMEYAVASALRAFAPLFVETVEKWRKICLDISEGREPEPYTPPGAAGAGPGAGGGAGPKAAPHTGRPGLGGAGEGFIKI